MPDCAGWPASIEAASLISCVLTLKEEGTRVLNWSVRSLPLCLAKSRGGMASIGTIDWVTDLGLCAGSDRDDLFELLPIFPLDRFIAITAFQAKRPQPPGTNTSKI